MSRFCRCCLMVMIGSGPCVVGCALTPYRFGQFHDDGEERSDDITFEFGRPNKALDRMAWIVGFPTRILPMHPSVNNHSFSAETSEKLSSFMRDNDITDVLVRVNQYDPAGEFRRLRQNKRIAAGWRYTFGLGTVVNYTLFPGRVFGGDTYNPWTNSLSVNSDLPAMLMVEAAYAKDIHARKYPGPYAAVNELPVLTLWRHTLAVNDTLGYARLHDDWDVERETYRVVYPLLGIHIALGGQSALSAATPLPLLTVPITAIGGAVAGHTFGQSTIARRTRERERDEVNDSSEDVGLAHFCESESDQDSKIRLTALPKPVTSDDKGSNAP